MSLTVERSCTLMRLCAFKLPPLHAKLQPFVYQTPRFARLLLDYFYLARSRSLRSWWWCFPVKKHSNQNQIAVDFAWISAMLFCLQFRRKTSHSPFFRYFLEARSCFLTHNWIKLPPNSVSIMSELFTCVQIFPIILFVSGDVWINCQSPRTRSDGNCVAMCSLELQVFIVRISSDRT